MKVAKNTVVALRYELYDSGGELVEKTDHPIEYLHGGYAGIFVAVERMLAGKDAGESCEVYLQPTDAFGEYDAQLVSIEPRSKFPADVKVGMRFEGQAVESGHTVVYTVTDIADEKVVVDGNHPLAGKALRFRCTIEAVRVATKEEITHRHTHGAHGHHH